MIKQCFFYIVIHIQCDCGSYFFVTFIYHMYPISQCLALAAFNRYVKLRFNISDELLSCILSVFITYFRFPNQGETRHIFAKPNVQIVRPGCLPLTLESRGKSSTRILSCVRRCLNTKLSPKRAADGFSAGRFYTMMYTGFERIKKLMSPNSRNTTNIKESEIIANVPTQTNTHT